jgi:serine/threonine-protein kinase ATR
VLDYLSGWIQAKQLASSKLRVQDQAEAEDQIRKVTTLLESIPAKIVSNRAIQCKSYARALFYWEQHIRHARDKETDELQETRDMERLQEIYTQIDEPDGIEGISAHLHVLDIDQIILGHRKAGRWTAAQSWYEIKLADDPGNVDVQLNLLTCLKASGQHGKYLSPSKITWLLTLFPDVLLNYVEGMLGNIDTMGLLLPFATEASWATERWGALEKYTEMATSEAGEDFNVSVGKALLALRRDRDPMMFTSSVRALRRQIACSLSRSTTSSIGSFHDSMLKFHVLTELEMIAGTDSDEEIPRHQLIESLDRRLETIGAYLNDKQYLLGIRRAAMQRSRFVSML